MPDTAITAWLDERRVRADVEAKSKKRALETAAELLAAGLPDHTAQEILDSLIRRERLGCTALADGVAIPHARMPGLERSVAAFVSLRTPVDFDAASAQPVDLVLAVLVPEQCSQRQLQLVTEASRELSDAHLCQALRHADTDHTLYELLAHGPPPPAAAVVNQ